MERMGLGPVAARVYVYLLYCDETGATFEDMVAYFSVSKSAVSNALKMLKAVEMVDSRTMGGKRKRFFYINFQNMFNERYMETRIKSFSKMLEDIRADRAKDDGFAQELENVALLYSMLLVEYPIMIERWRRTVAMRANKD